MPHPLPPALTLAQISQNLPQSAQKGLMQFIGVAGVVGQDQEYLPVPHQPRALPLPDQPLDQHLQAPLAEQLEQVVAAGGGGVEEKVVDDLGLGAMGF